MPWYKHRSAVQAHSGHRNNLQMVSPGVEEFTPVPHFEDRAILHCQLIFLSSGTDTHEACFFLPRTNCHSISPFFFHCSANFHFLSHAYEQIHPDTFSGLFFFCKSYSRLIWEGKYSIYSGIKITLTIVEKFYSFIEKIVIWHFLSARHSSRFQKFSCERARHIPCPHGAYSVVKETM